MPCMDASGSPTLRSPTKTPESSDSVQKELSEGALSTRVKCIKGMQVRKGIEVPEEYAAEGLIINEFDEVCCSRCYRGPLRTAEQIEEHVQLHEEMNDFSEARWKKHGFQIVYKGKLGCTWCPEGPFDTPLQAFKHIKSPFHKRNAANMQDTQKGELTDDYREHGVTVQNGVGFCLCGAGPFFFACHIDVHVLSAKHLKFWRKMDEMNGTYEPDNVVLRNEHNMFVCAKCNIVLQTEESYTEHLLGQRHRRACAATAREPLEMLPEWEKEGIVRKERGAFCSKCEKVLHTKEDVAAHISGRTHNRKNLSFSGIIARVFPDGYAFVNSRDASAKYGTGDVFVPAALVAMERLDVGDPVRFSLDMTVNEDTNCHNVVANYIELCDRRHVRREEIQRFDGVIKSFCEENGYGFISCPSLKEKYSRDVFVNLKQIPSELRHVGQRVSFEVTMNRRGQPQAQKVEDATVHDATVVTTEEGHTFFHCAKLGKSFLAADANALKNGDVVQFKLDDDLMPYDVELAPEEDCNTSAAKVVSPQPDARPGDPHVEDGVSFLQESSHCQIISSNSSAPPTEPGSSAPAPTTLCEPEEKPTTAEPILIPTVSSTLNVSEFSHHAADVNRKEEQTAQIKTQTPAHINLPIDEKKRVVHVPQQTQVDGQALSCPLAPPVPKGSSVSSTSSVSRVLQPVPAASSKVTLPEEVRRVTPPLSPLTRSATPSCPPSPAGATPMSATIAIAPLPRPLKGLNSASRPTTASSTASGHDKEDLEGSMAQSLDDDNTSKAERKRLKKERKLLKKERKHAKKLKKEEKRGAVNDVRNDGSVSVVGKKDKKRAKEHARERRNTCEGWKSPRSLHSAHVASAAQADWLPRLNVGHEDAMASLAPPNQGLARMKDQWSAPSLNISETGASGSKAIGSLCALRSKRGHRGFATRREDADFHEQKTFEGVASNLEGKAPEQSMRELRPIMLDFSSN